MRGWFVSLGNCSHLSSKLANGTENLLGSLSGWLLYAIDISGKETFINAYGTGDFRDIQLRKPFEDIRISLTYRSALHRVMR